MSAKVTIKHLKGLLLATRQAFKFYAIDQESKVFKCEIKRSKLNLDNQNFQLILITNVSTGSVEVTIPWYFTYCLINSSIVTVYTIILYIMDRYRYYADTT